MTDRPRLQRLSALLDEALDLDAAQRPGWLAALVHRDLMPSNVLVTAQGDPKLLDFGIAGLLEDGEQAGGSDITHQTGRGLTPGYAAPEQIIGAPLGTAAEVFLPGVMLFELLSGELPFGARPGPCGRCRGAGEGRPRPAGGASGGRRGARLRPGRSGPGPGPPGPAAG